jgi:hypothetical protein
MLTKLKEPDRDMVHGPIKGYKITYTPQGGNKKTIDVGVVTTYTLTSLLKYTFYRITILVKNTKYIGPPSEEQSVRTMEDGKTVSIGSRFASNSFKRY